MHMRAGQYWIFDSLHMDGGEDRLAHMSDKIPTGSPLPVGIS